MNIYANIIDKKDHVLTEHANFDQLASIKILSIMDQIHCIANSRTYRAHLLWRNSSFSLHFPLACSIVHSSLMLRQIQPPISTTKNGSHSGIWTNWNSWNHHINPKRYSTNTADFALVIPTFIRRISSTNPIPLSLLALTHENIAMSFSRPWKRDESIL